MRLISLLGSLVVLKASLVASFPFGAAALNEVQRLLSIVDPKTCGCRTQSDCEVFIPNAQYVGFRCDASPGTRFCCNRRPLKAPKMTVSEMKKSIPDALRNQIQSSMKPDTDGDALHEVIVPEEKRNKVIIKPASSFHDAKPTAKTDVPNEMTDEEVKLQSNENKHCKCVPNDKCQNDQVDYTFGKSCSFGHVRCCETDSKEIISLETNNDSNHTKVNQQEEKSGQENQRFSLPYTLIPEKHDVRTPPNSSEINDKLLKNAPNQSTPPSSSLMNPITPSHQRTVNVQRQNQIPGPRAEEEFRRREAFRRRMAHLARMRHLHRQQQLQQQQNGSLLGSIAAALSNVGSSISSIGGLIG